MFCNQCGQTQNSHGCTEIGVCGKDPDMQSLQEILLYGVKGMAAYPKLRAHAHLVGHFGGPWQNQQWEFPAFSGPIVATTNCILIPPETYKDRLFTTRVTAVPGGKRLKNSDFRDVIALAKKSPSLPERKVRESTIGFHHSVVLGLADKVVAAVKAGDIKRFFVIGGCDGAEIGRNYFSKLAQAAPKESIIITLGCGKYRIRNHDYGTVAGLPRLLDMGQCNDAFGAVQVAVGLAKAFQCGMNDLPLSIVLSWFEQKAVAVLLTLLALGVKGIRVGPLPPAFSTPNVFKVLQEKFDLKLTEAEPPTSLYSLTTVPPAAASMPV